MTLSLSRILNVILFIASGIALIALGALFLLQQVGLANASQFLEGMWPNVIFIAGLVPLSASPEPATRPAWPGRWIIILVVGLGLLWIIHGLMPDSALAYLWPVALIAVGAWILLKRVPSVQRTD